MTEQTPSDALHDPTTPDGSGREDYPAPGAGPDVLAALESYTLAVNGRDRDVTEAWLGESLLWVLRERLGLPGAKNACEQGECGSCSVLLDGRLVASCCVLAADAVGSQITTVEGLSGEGELSDVQRAFVEEGAVQCGFCTPGLVVAIHDVLHRNPRATELELREAISGDLCRCTGYGRIFAAVRRVQQERAHART
ncbi:MAG TPA: (2Fe-2S)-binding protein [Actinomycetes bacterium]|jgi:carbon-monoxide dehydrogenase small subunit|nr:(2Fe-2S)-binding protein [Actinomycetes bacterium]